MTPTDVLLRLDGDGRLVSLRPASARALIKRLREVNHLSAHELSLFDFEPEEGASLLPRLSWARGEGRSLPRISARELRRVEGVVSERVLSGRWRFGADEGQIQRGTLPGFRPGSLRRCVFIALFGMIFVVEPLRPETLYQGPHRDVIAQLASREVRLLRFEGVTTRGGGLGLGLRDRARLDVAWVQPLVDGSVGGVRRWFAVRSVLAQPGFLLAPAPTLRGAQRPWSRDTWRGGVGAFGAREAGGQTEEETRHDPQPVGETNDADAPFSPRPGADRR